MMNQTMAAVIFDQRLRYVRHWPCPAVPPGWARIRVRLAGICQTDLEIIRGYLGFQGVLGHEFVGEVEECEDSRWIGRRVVGEINAACGHCDWCQQDLGRHCPQRSTLGIVQLDGCMAEFCRLPMANLHLVEASLADEQAIFTEPLAAACEIPEQLPLTGKERVIVLGDGRLGILCAWVLVTITPHVTLVGHHSTKLALARWRSIETSLRGEGLHSGADIVVDATGSIQGFKQALSLCRPRGTIVLKTTTADRSHIDLARIVIDELTIVGSRCGQFRKALTLMQQFPDLPLTRLISHRFPLPQAAEAFAQARQGDALKVLLYIS